MMKFRQSCAKLTCEVKGKQMWLHKIKILFWMHKWFAPTKKIGILILGTERIPVQILICEFQVSLDELARFPFILLKLHIPSV